MEIVHLNSHKPERTACQDCPVACEDRDHYIREYYRGTVVRKCEVKNARLQEQEQPMAPGR